MPTPEAVFRAVGLLARGVDGRDGLGDLMMVDIGGATTDVYSCASGDPQSAGTVLKGLREPYEKRTVEGDVGMRHTLGYLLEAASSETLAADCGVAPDAVAAWAARVAERPEILAETPEERRIDAACARAGCRIAVRRHCGRLEETFTPDGRLYVQRGKDLRAVPTVVGSGGALVWPDAAADILSGVRRGENEEALMPEKPALLLDARYTMWAAGLLAEREPRAALAMMKKNLVPVACGDPETPKGAAPLSREE